MSKITRISTTITARYVPDGGTVDGYWLDGRTPSQRESRAADITLDREDRGFFFSVYSTPAISKDPGHDLTSVFPYLEKMGSDLIYSQKDIDALIVDFSQTANNVVGSKTIIQEGVRSPFFSGIIVKGDEIAAVTTGRGCAYLYRNDTLFPLTKDDLNFEAVDFNGIAVKNFDIYSAGSVGNVRYSNIPNLQVDDCLILCNKEIMSAIGQKEILRIFDEAYDQAEAAGMIITAAASKLPNVSLQFMMSFVESISDSTEKYLPRQKATILSSVGHTGTRVDEGSKDRIERTKDIPTQGEPLVYADGPVDDDYYDEDEYDNDYYYEDSDTAKKIALTSVILVVIAACAFVIWWTVFKDRNPGTDVSGSGSDYLSQAEVSQVISAGESGLDESDSDVSEGVGGESSLAQSSPQPTSPAISSSSGSVSRPASSIIATHTIQPGELLGAIAQRYYGSQNLTYLNAIVEANKAKYPSFTLDHYGSGWVIDIPSVG